MSTLLNRKILSGLTETMVLGGDVVLLPVPDMQADPLAYLYAGERPDDLKSQPRNIQASYAYDQAIRENDALAVMNHFSGTGVWYMVNEGGLCEDACQTFNLERLRGIRQLAFLQAPDRRETIYHQPIAQHTRLLHSFDVMLLATLIGCNCGLEPSELNTLRMAAMTHDMGTPAGGDSVKMIDLPALDEDAHYERLLGLFPNRNDLWRKHGICEETLIATVHNQGLLGSILDIADKMAYTARDTWACRPFIEYGAMHSWWQQRPELQTLLNSINAAGDGLVPWESVERIDNQIVFTDAQRLNTFLGVRVRMFREVYMHPHARVGEWLVANVIAKFLYQQGTLTRDQLLGIQDYELEAIFDREFPGRHVLASGMVDRTSDAVACKVFDTRAKAERFWERQVKKGNLFVLIEDVQKLAKTGAHFLVKQGEKVTPFSQAFPDETARLQDIATREGTYVYYLVEETGIPSEKLARLLAAYVQ